MVIVFGAIAVLFIGSGLFWIGLALRGPPKGSDEAPVPHLRHQHIDAKFRSKAKARAGFQTFLAVRRRP